MSRPRRRMHTVYTEVEVDLDLHDILADLDDDELAEFGVMRIPEGWPEGGADEHGLTSEGLATHIWAVNSVRANSA